jgi:hypothetical protein
MNKKRKILTLFALFAFSVIIILRCSGWPAYHHSYWKNADVFDRVDKNTVTRTIPSDAPADAPDWARAPLVQALVPGYWNWERPPLRLNRDFHMSLFVLAVFYAGLFAILGDNKRKEQ